MLWWSSWVSSSSGTGLFAHAQQNYQWVLCLVHSAKTLACSLKFRIGHRNLATFFRFYCDRVNPSTLLLRTAQTRDAITTERNREVLCACATTVTCCAHAPQLCCRTTQWLESWLINSEFRCTFAETVAFNGASWKQNRRQKVFNRGALRFCGGLECVRGGAWHFKN